MTHFDPKVTPWSVEEADYPAQGSLPERMQFLLRYAILAPSSHNTQPWRFRLFDEGVEILLDHSRWLRVADSDQRELHISAGCALENLLIAAEHFALGHTVTLLPDESQPLLAARVSFAESASRHPHRHADLFEMIRVRHTNHGIYDGHPVPDDVRERLHNCCVEPELAVHLTADPMLKKSVDEWLVQADATQFARPDYREELAHWIGQGVFGNSWLLAKLGQFAVSHFPLGKSVAKRDSELLMSAPLFGLIASRSDERAEQIMVGQVYQRIGLLAASHGIWCQPMSSLVEVEEFRRELMLAAAEGGMVAQHPFRLGYAEAESEHTPRRPLEDVLED